MGDKYAKIRFSLNPKGKQDRTGDEFQPNMKLLDNDRDARQNSVPGRRTIAQQSSVDPQDPENDPVRAVEPDDEFKAKKKALTHLRARATNPNRK